MVGGFVKSQFVCFNAVPRFGVLSRNYPRKEFSNFPSYLVSTNSILSLKGSKFINYVKVVYKLLFRSFFFIY